MYIFYMVNCFHSPFAIQKFKWYIYKSLGQGQWNSWVEYNLESVRAQCFAVTLLFLHPFSSSFLANLPDDLLSFTLTCFASFFAVCVWWGVSLNGMKQNACHLPFHDHFGHIVSATSKPGNSVNSRTNLNAACMQEGYLL